MILCYQGLKTYFSDRELGCRHCGVVLCDPVFTSQLRALRHLYGKPMTVNSVCRCPEHNETIGGHPRSLHLTTNPVHPTNGCIAVDVDITKMSEEDLEDFISLAWELGWSIGIAKTFLHIDRRVEFGLKQIRWNYGK